MKLHDNSLFSIQKIFKFTKKVILLCFVVISLSGCKTTGSSSFSGLPDSRPATGGRVFLYYPNHHAWAAYDANGQLANTGRATGGKLYCPDIGRPCKTVVGRFRILSKGDASCKSSKYPVSTNGGAPMPYCMKFHPKGYAIHGTNYVPNSYNSHGCIGVSVGDAHWLNNYLPVGSLVIVRPY